MSKQSRVLKHLQEVGNITSLEAFNLFGATRLSAIIFNLRQDGYIISNSWEDGTDRFGERTHYVRYIYGGMCEWRKNLEKMLEAKKNEA